LATSWHAISPSSKTKTSFCSFIRLSTRVAKRATQIFLSSLLSHSNLHARSQTWPLCLPRLPPLLANTPLTPYPIPPIPPGTIKIARSLTKPPIAVTTTIWSIQYWRTWHAGMPGAARFAPRLYKTPAGGAAAAAAAAADRGGQERTQSYLWSFLVPPFPPFLFQHSFRAASHDEHTSSHDEHTSLHCRCLRSRFDQAVSGFIELSL
jgi:hypothetical protein